MLDTNVVSDLMRRTPAPAVVSWLDRQDASDVWLTAMTAAELLAGVARLPSGTRKRQLAAQVQSLLAEVFDGRILAFDQNAAVAYARIVTARLGAGTPISTADAVIAGTCLGAGAGAFATRNTADFLDIGLALVDPWDGAAR